MMGVLVFVIILRCVCVCKGVFAPATVGVYGLLYLFSKQNLRLQNSVSGKSRFWFLYPLILNTVVRCQGQVSLHKGYGDFSK